MSGETHYDAIIVGGGHNGLVCAAYLGTAGLKVLVLEAAAQLGGAAVTREFHPGYRASAVAHLLHLLHPRVIADLKLTQHGLAFAATDLPTTALLPDGDRLTLAADPAASRTALARFSPHDAEALPAFTERFNRLAAALGRFLLKTPPQISAAQWQDRRTLLEFALSLRRLGRRDMRELTRIIGMNAADLLDDNFESDALKGVFALDSVLGGFLGPKSPNSVFNLLYRAAGNVAGRQNGLIQPKGGMGAVTAALASAASAAGVELRTGAPVEWIRIADGRAVGVVLESGREISARHILSSADPRRTFLTLVGPEHLDTGFVRHVRGIHMNGCAAKIHLALDGLPEAWQADPEMTAGRLVVAPSIDFMERAFDDAKYGRVSEAPALEVTVPSLHDSALAPAGGHVLSIVAQFAPYQLRETVAEAARDQIAARVLAALGTVAPDLPDRVRAQEVLTPQDLERQFRLTGGHWHHGEMSLDQVFLLRPVGGFQQYRTPIDGLYLCGAGAHPGGGVSGAPGANAAREVLKDHKLPRAA
ncbi:phytoene desaturase family protein [Rhodospirillaceae bacterium SYSU D60014]|uniref:phytoene desaturase family protein n=1 Tax=Virgifigura deserti TaxID=2268457 RepID=UPI000E66F623